jgi:Amino-transferase class IV
MHPPGGVALRIAVAPEVDGELAATIERRPTGHFAPDNGGQSSTRPMSLRSLTLAGGLGAHKWVDRSLLDQVQARMPDDALPLLVDEDGTVLEASRANVFAIRDGTLLTPPADGRILPGITRMRVLEIAGTMGIDLREEPLTRNDLLAADEVFLTGSIRGIERVDALDGRPLDSRGEIANRVSAELWSAWRHAKKSGKSPEQNERESGEVDDQARRSRDESRVAALPGTSGRGRVAQRHSASSGPRAF